MLREMRLADLAEAVAAKTPTPGGGSVAAAVAALGAALGVMAARFSDDAEAERALDAAKSALLPLVDADAKAYGQVDAARALPKATDDEKSRRREVLQNALAEAAAVPLEGMRLAVRALEALGTLAPHCNRHLASDLAGAALFLSAAAAGCGENVRVNAMALRDKGRRETLEAERARLSAAAAERRGGILEAVEKLYAGE